MTTTSLDDIGFYTLSEYRASHISHYSPLWRCELILTDRCNFRCGYCRGVKPEYRGDLPIGDAAHILNEWIAHGLKHVRFSGGEPTVYPGLIALVIIASRKCDRVAISTNGSADLSVYDQLLRAGVSDFSISLDACCASTGKAMAGVAGQWERVCKTIRYLSRRTYVTVGVVLTERNLPEATGIVKFAHDLGVADIRLIPAAQDGRTMRAIEIPDDILSAHPILKYRIANLRAGVDVRGLSDNDNRRCPLVLDDMAVIGNDHYPCPIYMREQGKPIGKFTDIENVRSQRLMWFLHHDTHEDPICQSNCLDFCRQFNNSVDNGRIIDEINRCL